MNSKLRLPSIGPGRGRLHFGLPLLALLLWGSALSSASGGTPYQDISIDKPCPNPTDNPSHKTFAANLNTILDNLSVADKTIAVHAPNPVTNVLWGVDAGCDTTAFPNVTCGTITIKFPDGTKTSICDPSFKDSPNCAAPKGMTATIGGTFTADPTDFTLRVAEADDSNASPSCPAAYHFHTPTSGLGWGDPHITTVDGVHYDFQSAGEFTALRGDGLEVQTRQTGIATTFLPGANPYTGLATCVALYSAVAARVGTHRVSYEPNVSGVPDPSGLQLRVDSVLATLPPGGIDLGPGGQINQSPTGGAAAQPSVGGRIIKSPAGGGIEIHYSDGTQLVVTPNWWPDQQKWYLNVTVYDTTGTEGVFGKLAKGSWLPALPDRSSLGPRPDALHQRYLDLYGKFADAWRVTDATSLFDYAPGTSTATFTDRGWPRENPESCAIEGEPSAGPPVDVGVAQQQCSAITDNNMRADCVFDVSVTGFTGFANTYVLTQQLQPDATETTVKGDKDPSEQGESVGFTATVAQRVSRGGAAPAGSMQFILDGGKVGNPITLDSGGRALWSSSGLQVGQHQIVAQYIPTSWGNLFLASTSPAVSHTVIAANYLLYFWIIILLLIITLILMGFIIWRYRRTT